MKRGLKITKYILLFGIAICVLFGILIGYFGALSKAKKADCIIILGCQVRGTTPSKFLVARLDEGVRLHKEGLAKFIIVSGGQGPGENVSEAEVMKDYLILKGIDEANIVVEDKSHSTMENLKNAKKIMDSMGFKEAIVVSNKYHLKRASVMAKRNGIKGSFSGVIVSKYPLYEIMGFFREIPALMRLYILGR